MKKIVRLTESDLHGIIRNSVNKILSELDWRTYANAANKSAERQKDYKEKSKEKKWYDSILPSRARKRQGKISNLADKEMIGQGDLLQQQTMLLKTNWDIRARMVLNIILVYV